MEDNRESAWILTRKIAACEDVLSTLHVLRQRLRREKNTLASPITKLPSELLLIIFDLAVRPDLHYYKDLTNFRLVTSQWAKVIEDHPLLWRFAHCTDSPKLTRLALHRSQDIPLHIRLLCLEAPEEQIALKRHDHSKWSAPSFNHRITKVLPRWESLTVKHDSSDGLEPFLNTAPPNIKRCSITVNSRATARQLFPTRNGVSASLESLYVNGFSPLLGKVTFPNLRTLAIHNLQATSPSFSELMAAIRGFPMLESLEVANCTIPCGSNLQDPRTFVPAILPQLKRVTLAEIPRTAIAHLLSHIETPAIRSLFIRTRLHADIGLSQDQLIQFDEILDTIQSLRRLIPLFREETLTDSEAPFTPMVRMIPNQLSLEFGQDAAFRVLITGYGLERYFWGWSNLVGQAASCNHPIASLQLHLAADTISDEELMNHLIAMDTYFPSVTKLTFIDQKGLPLPFGVPIPGQSRWLFPAAASLRISLDVRKVFSEAVPKVVVENVINIANARHQAAGSERPSRLQEIKLHGEWPDAEIADIQSRTGIPTSMAPCWMGPDYHYMY